jgi:hypothetical protein
VATKLALPIPSAGGSDGAFGYRCLLWLGATMTTGSAKERGLKVPRWA